MAADYETKELLKELNLNLKMTTSALNNLTVQLSSLEAITTCANSLAPVGNASANAKEAQTRTWGYVNWNSSHDILKTKHWVKMTVFTDYCGLVEREQRYNCFEKIKMLKTMENKFVVDEKTRFPEDANTPDVYVNANNPIVRAEILQIKESRKAVPGLVERFMNVAKNDMHTLNSFEESYALKWVEPYTEARNETTAPVLLTQVSSPAPVNDILYEPAIPVSCSAREDVQLEEVDSATKQTTYKKDNFTDFLLHKANNDIHTLISVEEKYELKRVQPFAVTSALVQEAMPLPRVSSPTLVNNFLRELAIPVSNSAREDVKLKEVDSDMEPTTFKKENLTESILNIAKNDMHIISSVEQKYELKQVEPFSEACSVMSASLQESMPLSHVSSPGLVNDSHFEPAIPVSCSARKDVKLEEEDYNIEQTTFEVEHLGDRLLNKAKNDKHKFISFQDKHKLKRVEPFAKTCPLVPELMPLPRVSSTAAVSDYLHEPAIPVSSSAREDVKLKEVVSDMEPTKFNKENLTERLLNKAKNDTHKFISVGDKHELKRVEHFAKACPSVPELMPRPPISSAAAVSDYIHKPAIPISSSAREDVKLEEVDSDNERTALKKENLTERLLNQTKNKNYMHTLRSVEEKYKPKRVEPVLEEFSVTTASVQEPLPLPHVSSPAPVNDSRFKLAIPVSCIAREDVKLGEVDSDVVTITFKKDIFTEDAIKTTALCKKLKDILDKLTKQKLNILLKKVKNLEINNQKRLEMVVDLLIEKAIKEPDLSYACAAMSQKLSYIKVPSEDNPKQFINFRALIISKCQNQFESWKTDDQEKIEKELAKTNDSVKKEELQVILDEENKKIRLRAVANVRFIGELYKLKMLTGKIIDYCIKNLITNDETKLECLCQLLTTIGKEFEFGHHVNQLNDIFEQMQQIVDCKSNNISSRVKFLIQNVIELGSTWSVIGIPK